MAPDVTVNNGTATSGQTSFIPAECQRLQSCLRCPGFQLPWSGQRSHSTGGGQHMNGGHAVQRLKEARDLAWNARIVWVVIHLGIVGLLFLLDSTLATAYHEKNYWFLGFFILLLLLTVVQYSLTSGSSPGYMQEIQDAVESEAEEGIVSTDPSTPLFGQSGSTSSQPGDLAREDSVDANLSEEAPYPKSESWQQKFSTFLKWHNQRLIVRSNSALLRRTDSNRRCPYCQVWQPMRTKHCHDCDKCVLRFDHHCFWVGTCVGQRNHRKFWWYLFLESALASWTFIISLTAFAWGDPSGLGFLHNALAFCLALTLFALSAFLIVLLAFHTYLVVTNQTTYETTRRKRISYLRHVPANVHPFSRGLWRNVYSFCCTSSYVYLSYDLPPLEELQRRSERQTWFEEDYFRCV